MPASRAARVCWVRSGGGVVGLGGRERDPLDRAGRQRVVAQLGAQADVAAQRRRRPAEHAEEVGQLPAAAAPPT